MHTAWHPAQTQQNNASRQGRAIPPNRNTQAGCSWTSGDGNNLVELVLLAKLHTLFPAVVALEKVGSDSPKLNQLVLLQALRQGDVVKVVVCIY